MIKVFTTDKQKIGELGEKVALYYYINKGFVSCETNYSSRSGEIDLILKGFNKIVFVEVKTRIYKTVEIAINYRSFSPIDNFTKTKMFHMKRTVKNYMSKNNVSHETEIEMIIAEVYIIGSVYKDRSVVSKNTYYIREQAIYTS